jgi:hypothetical protein
MSKHNLPNHWPEFHAHVLAVGDDAVRIGRHAKAFSA